MQNMRVVSTQKWPYRSAADVGWAERYEGDSESN